MDTLSGEVTAVFIFWLPFQWETTLTETNSLSESKQILSLIVVPISK